MEKNWVAITPLQVDRTDYDLLGRLRERFAQEFPFSGK